MCQKFLVGTTYLGYSDHLSTLFLTLCTYISMSITIHCEYCDVIIQIFYFFPFNHQIKKVLAAKTFDRRARSEPKIEGLATNIIINSSHFPLNNSIWYLFDKIEILQKNGKFEIVWKVQDIYNINFYQFSMADNLIIGCFHLP